jgi:hypothetical protein
MTAWLSNWTTDISKFQGRDVDVQGVENAIRHWQVVGVRQGEQAAKFLQRQSTIEEQIQDLCADGMQMRGQAGKQARCHAKII